MRCKVFLNTLTYAPYSNGGVEAEFRPVTSGSEENKSFHAATPGGSFKVTLSEQAAKQLDAYRLGAEFYVDFTPVAKPS